MRKLVFIIAFLSVNFYATSQGISDYGFNSAAEITDSIAALKDGDMFTVNITGYFEEYIWLLGLRAMEYSRMKEFDKAIEDYDEILSFDSTDQVTLLNKAKILFNSRRLEEAIDAFDMAIINDPEDADLWRFKAMALDMLGRREEAATCRTKYKEMTKQ